MNLSYIISNKDLYLNVKEVLTSYFNISNRLLLRLKTNNKILLNGTPVNVKSLVFTGDILSVLIDFDEDNSNIIPIEMDLSIIYEDDSILVIDKPPNMAIHPSFQHYSNSLSNGVKFYFDKIGLHKKIRIVNRLDIDTSGIVIFAKNEYVQECLIKQMQENIFIKEYIGVIDGELDDLEGTINAPIERKDGSIIERCIREDGATAITHYKVLEKFDNMSVVKFRLETGRTHQIRVHCSYIGHPIVGDTLYGIPSNIFDRQALHSYKIRFIHPLTRKYIEFICEIKFL